MRSVPIIQNTPQTMNLQELIRQGGPLPTIPKLGQQLIASFSDDDVDIDTIARQLGADPALSAKLLRLANSAYFHVSRTIATVPAALQMLGFVMVRNLVLGASVAGAYPRVAGVDLKAFWRYSLYTACVARWLAPRVKVNADLLFTLGLIHSVGQLQIHAAAPQEAAALDARLDVLDAQRAAAERAAWGWDHLQVSSEMARAWNFPPPMADVLHAVGHPLQAQPWSSEAAVIHLAAWRARADVLGWTPVQRLDAYPTEVADRLGVDAAWFAPATAETDDPQSLPPLPELTDGMESMFG